MRSSWNRESRVTERRSAIARTTIAATLLAAAVEAQTVRLSTENDILTGNPTRDDLYSFSIGFELERGLASWAIFEQAFTDRAAGVRFDETHLELRRSVLAARGWSLALGAGVVRVGEGLFGERLQNAVHDAIGSDRVELPYHDESWHVRLLVSAERWRAFGASFEAAPHVELDVAPGHRSLAAAGAQARWQPAPDWVIEAFAGARWARASLAPLEPHLGGVDLAARIGLLWRERYLLSWSLNAHGDRREHWTVGYVLPIGRSDERDAPPPQRS